MGTRNLTLVYYKGQYRIIQYGQWDGYPSGQGLKILSFLRDPSNIARLQDALDSNDNRIIVISDEERTAYFEDLERQQIAQKSFMPLPAIPSLSRDTGAGILAIVANVTKAEPVKIHLCEADFLADKVFMEWAWVVDLDNKLLEAYTYWERYKVLDEKSRFAELVGSEENLPGLVKRFGFDELPEVDSDFLGDFEDSLVDEEEDSLDDEEEDLIDDEEEEE
ncbi:hypothetical protein E4T49_07510 [Aureobasidium sp. EXF-10728]|nr:hypothetical protein E4T49_07510 [Aureobasidium sp. EXF-10728]